MINNSRRFCASSLILAVLQACATPPPYLRDAPTGAQCLVFELNATLTRYEATAIAVPRDPAEALALEAIQSARKALILRVIECLVSEYPDIDATAYLERLNVATARAPDG